MNNMENTTGNPIKKKDYYERNLLALTRLDPSLCSRLSKAETTLNRYKFLETSSGAVVPALVDKSGAAHPLHSMVDPIREAKRITDTINDEGFIIFLGLGGGYYAEAALEKDSASLVLVIDYDINGIAELLSCREYIKIFNDQRFHFLVDPSSAEIVQYILGVYQPVLCEGIRTLPLRSRTSGDIANFNSAAAAIENAIQRVSSDYSVQAHFGMRWFSNIIRNMENAEMNFSPIPPVKKAAVTAAGPSLFSQTNIIRERRKDFFLIATDTSLPCLLSEKIIPDAVVSIDCQHISYYHFMSGLPEETMLFLDLAGPHLAASQTKNVRFFSGNHPLTGYINANWRSLPEIDTSGGNVTYTSVVLAEKLGAHTVELFGADFSYPSGLSYARGAYIHPFFEIRQKRLAPLESQYSAFLYRGQLEKKTGTAGWYYESPSLKFYRERLEEKCRVLDIKLIPHQGSGACFHAPVTEKKPGQGKSISLFAAGKPIMKSKEFLIEYKNDMKSISISSYYSRGREKQIFTTLLPMAAAFKRRNPGLKADDILNKTISHCIAEIDKILHG